MISVLPPEEFMRNSNHLKNIELLPIGNGKKYSQLYEPVTAESEGFN